MKKNKRMLVSVVSLILSLLVTSGTANAVEDVSIAPAASMNERVYSVPGDSERPALLQVTVLTPAGTGPFPLVVMNHGSSASARPDLEPRYRYTFSAYYFLSRGYAVALPMMRGFSGSEGKQILNGCNQESVGLANARDIRAVVDFMLTQSYVDGNQVVMAGQSLGGWNTLAFGTLNHPNVKGLINFAGGANISTCGSTLDTLARAAEHFGAQTSIPSIWFYGENDSKFAPPIWHAMYEHYSDAGGHAELVEYGRFMIDSHNLLGFPEGLTIWAPKVDEFLSKIGMSNSITHPEYLPAVFPQPTNFASIDDVDAVPYLNDEGKKTYRKFLSDPMPKVFVVSAGGLSASFNGGFDPLGRAMAACKKYSQQCKVYAADDYVTWEPAAPAPEATNFASISDIAAIPYLNNVGRQGYQKYLSLNKPKAFVIASDGAWVYSSKGNDPSTSAMEACNKSHRGCQIYAVDDAVVWR